MSAYFEPRITLRRVRVFSRDQNPRENTESNSPGAWAESVTNLARVDADPRAEKQETVPPFLPMISCSMRRDVSDFLSLYGVVPMAIQSTHGCHIKSVDQHTCEK